MCPENTAEVIHHLCLLESFLLLQRSLSHEGRDEISTSRLGLSIPVPLILPPLAGCESLCELESTAGSCSDEG